MTFLKLENYQRWASGARGKEKNIHIVGTSHVQSNICTNLFSSREITDWCIQPGGLQRESWRGIYPPWRAGSNLRSFPEILWICISINNTLPWSSISVLLATQMWVLPAPCSQVLQPACSLPKVGSTHSSLNPFPLHSPNVGTRIITSDKNNEWALVTAKPHFLRAVLVSAIGAPSQLVCAGALQLTATQTQPLADRCLAVQPPLANLTQLHAIMVVSVSQGQETATGQGKSPL